MQLALPRSAPRPPPSSELVSKAPQRQDSLQEGSSLTANQVTNENPTKSPVRPPIKLALPRSAPRPPPSSELVSKPSQHQDSLQKDSSLTANQDASEQMKKSPVRSPYPLRRTASRILSYQIKLSGTEILPKKDVVLVKGVDESPEDREQLWIDVNKNEPVCKECFLRELRCTMRKNGHKCGFCHLNKRDCTWPVKEDESSTRPAHTVGEEKRIKPRLAPPSEASNAVFTRKKKSGRKGSSVYKKRSPQDQFPGITKEWPEDRESPVDGSEFVKRFSGNTPWEYLVQPTPHGISPNVANRATQGLGARHEGDGRLNPSVHIVENSNDNVAQGSRSALPSSELNVEASKEFKEQATKTRQVLPALGSSPEKIIKTSSLMTRRVNSPFQQPMDTDPSQMQTCENQDIPQDVVDELLASFYPSTFPVPLETTPHSNAPALSREGSYFDQSETTSTTEPVTPAVDTDRGQIYPRPVPLRKEPTPQIDYFSSGPIHSDLTPGEWSQYLPPVTNFFDSNKANVEQLYEIFREAGFDMEGVTHSSFSNDQIAQDTHFVYSEKDIRNRVYDGWLKVLGEGVHPDELVIQASEANANAGMDGLHCDPGAVLETVFNRERPLTGYN